MAAVVEKLDVAAAPEMKKKGRSRKALAQKNPSPNEANIVAGALASVAPSLPEDSAGKENPAILSDPMSQKRSKKGAAKAKQQPSFEKELQEMQEQLEKLKLEKEHAEEMLKAKEESLKQKEEEIETKDREKEKLKTEIKKLQKIKEFKPTMTFPVEHESKDKKKSSRKKPSPAYVLWCKDQWNEVKKANPEADFKEMSNLLSTKWKTVTAEEKKPYEEKYLAEKEAYLKAVGNEKREQEAMRLLEQEHKQKTAIDLLEQYLQFKQQIEEEPKKNKKEKKDPLKPKQPMSAYLIFSNERRAALVAENKTMLECARITGEEWKNMDEKQRAPYTEMALQKKEGYNREMELYKKKMEEEAANQKKENEELMKLHKQEAMQLLKKKEKAINLIKKTKEEQRKRKPSDPNKPKKPASSFLLFSKEARKSILEEHPGINNTTLTAHISLKWKELKDEERQIWNDKAAVAFQAYKKELEEYNRNKPEVEEPSQRLFCPSKRDQIPNPPLRWTKSPSVRLTVNRIPNPPWRGREPLSALSTTNRIRNPSCG